MLDIEHMVPARTEIVATAGKIFPPYRHVVVQRNGHRFPSQVTDETDSFLHTAFGVFSKESKALIGDPGIRYVGPISAEGDMECVL